MSAPRRRRTRKEEEESHPDERWMASYMDMVTVLMCMFIVLFAMSTVDQKKFEELRESLATGFGQVESNTVDTAVGIIASPDQVDGTEALEPDATLPSPGVAEVEVPDVADPAALAAAAAEVQDLTLLKEQIRTGLQEKGLADTVRFEIDDRGLTIRLVSSEMFFAPDAADLTSQAVQVLQTIGPIVAPTSYHASVEGHTAQVRQITDNALDWELSSSRAVTVLRYLVEESGIGYTRVKAVGFGESRPLTAGTSPAELAQNRRVDIVVLSGQTEEVRQLMPGIVAGQPAAASH
ncbi:flagellar motor protein MotB [Arthrobacter jiangjiafuii]|uniref:Flagellar motor protein MotB n=1 Tax=Arthrobacter jiangjiafuii TaxID=2817475 RepID=A0A975M5U5_9MICC|nr:flagellar motor protein MotB [Arthrobacter jiangjiafuii]MBP3045192.1 flagellar motor protein MotB [Arthrobacter jiangjiafuii]QWC10495.1 flagellar motor protein MotB [Arthrobacter jiangjiafuii]